MSCGCSGNGRIESWNDWYDAPPQDPRDVIAYASINAVAGSFDRVTPPAGAWSATPITFGAQLPTCHALETDNQLKVAEAQQWNFSHLTKSTLTNLPIPLDKVIFLRGGTEWEMQFLLDFGGDAVTDVYLTFRDNYGTRGDAQGTIPVITFTGGSFTNANLVQLTLKSYGRMSMAVVGTVLGNDTMYESEWIVVP